jgi:hypothetical protein
VSGAGARAENAGEFAANRNQLPGIDRVNRTFTI